MNFQWILFYITTIWLPTRSIVISLDRRHDYETFRKLMPVLENDWQPVNGHRRGIGIDAPALNGYQRIPVNQFISQSQGNSAFLDILKLPNQNKPQDFMPPSTIFQNHNNPRHKFMKNPEPSLFNLKELPSETRKYTFLIPPNRKFSQSINNNLPSKMKNSDFREITAIYPDGIRFLATEKPIVPEKQLFYSYSYQETPSPPPPPLNVARPTTTLVEYQNSHTPYLSSSGVRYNTRESEKSRDVEQTAYHSPHSAQQNNQRLHSYLDNDVSHAFPYKIRSYERNSGHLIPQNHEIGPTLSTMGFHSNSAHRYNYVTSPVAVATTIRPMRDGPFQLRPNKGSIETGILHFIQPVDYSRVLFNNTQRDIYESHREIDPVFVVPIERQKHEKNIVNPVDEAVKTDSSDTPESVSLMHYNKKLGEMLIYQDEERLREQELYLRQKVKIPQRDEQYQFSGQENLGFSRERQRYREEVRESSGSNDGSAVMDSGVGNKDNVQRIPANHQVSLNQRPNAPETFSTSDESSPSYQDTLRYRNPSNAAVQRNTLKSQKNPSKIRISDSHDQSPKHKTVKEPEISSPNPELSTTGLPVPETEIQKQERFIYSNEPQEVTYPPTQRMRNNRVAGKRRRRPTTPKLRQEHHETGHEHHDEVDYHESERKQIRTVKMKVETPRNETTKLRKDVVNPIEYPTEPQNYPTKITEKSIHQLEDVNKVLLLDSYNSVHETTVSSENDYNKEQDIVTNTNGTSTTESYVTTVNAETLSSPTPVSPSTTKAFKFRQQMSRKTSRPRFSIKEYQSRLDLKNKISQISTTEAVKASHPKQRATPGHKKKYPYGELTTSRETITNRHKFSPRLSHSSTPVIMTTPSGAHHDENTTPASHVRNKMNKFIPKRLRDKNLLYQNKTVDDIELTAEKGTDSVNDRVENLSRASIRKLFPPKNLGVPSAGSVDETEMMKEETNLYPSMTISEGQIVGINRAEETDTEDVVEDRENGPQTAQKKHDLLDGSTESELVENGAINNKNLENQPLEKVSQSIVKLTNSNSNFDDEVDEASGDFGMISPDPEERIHSIRSEISAGEGTLPIEAFFYNLSQKRD